MHVDETSGLRRVMRNIGSLWFGSVLLVLLLMALACATVYESINGTEAALKTFYMSGWFQFVLLLLSINVLAAVLARCPFKKSQIGFLMVHLSILVILGGAWITDTFGTNGQVAVAEGESVSSFRGTDQQLVIMNRVSGEQWTRLLDRDVFTGLVAVDQPDMVPLVVDDITLTVERYLPDSHSVERIVNDNPRIRHAVEVAFAEGGTSTSGWIFGGQEAGVGGLMAGLRVVETQEELTKWLETIPAQGAGSSGVVRVSLDGASYQFPLDDCLGKEIPLGGTGRTLKVLRYLPHAQVVDNKLTSISNRPENPAIEAEISGPSGTRFAQAFANFPDFARMHGGDEDENLKLTFIGPDPVADAHPPVALFLGPSGFHVRFEPTDGDSVDQPVSVGDAIPTPWSGRTFTIVQHFDRARIGTSIEAIPPRRESRIPAVLVRVDREGTSNSLWVQKYRPRPFTVDNVSFDLAVGDVAVPLGFELTLRKFRLGYYPGENRARSFESDVTIGDAASGREQGRTIGMNRPVKHGGYSLFQTSYRLPQGGNQKTISILSVARDPGMPVVFAGYFGVIGGMLVVLSRRLSDYRAKAAKDTGA